MSDASVDDDGDDDENSIYKLLGYVRACLIQVQGSQFSNRLQSIIHRNSENEQQHQMEMPNNFYIFISRRSLMYELLCMDVVRQVPLIARSFND